MLTAKDLKLVGDLMDKKFENFAILIQQEFRNIHGRIDGVESQIDGVEQKLNEKADKTDITRLEHKFEGRLERAEDDMRLVKTKLKLS